MNDFVNSFVNEPHNIEVEQALLGTLLSNNDLYDKVSGWVKPEHFYDPLHGRIYTAIVDCCEHGRRADPLTLKHKFSDEEPLGNDLSASQYLARLVKLAITPISAPDYARVIQEYAILRGLIKTGTEIVQRASSYQPGDSVDKQIEDAE
ncbi:MAG: replicative DNA helicase, partial [Desulfocapsa sp.]